MSSNDRKVESLTTLSQKIREYFKYPNDPLTTETNWYHILRWRLRWLNPFNPYNKDRRWSYFKLFFKVYLSRKPKKLREGIDYDQSI
jgi:hypothetical protein